MKKKEIKKKLSLFLAVITSLLMIFGDFALAETVDTIGESWLDNPIHYCTKEGDLTGNTDITEWSYVYFGTYPQTEVMGRELVPAITGAIYDANGDAWVNGEKYRRISQSDTNMDMYFGDSTYRYFKWEPIKWRVLKNDGDTIYVMTDMAIDCEDYNEEFVDTSWEKCTLRAWLNSSFYTTAFSDGEQKSVVEENVVNEDNPIYGTDGGNDTTDKVYLLSVQEVMNSNYGFCKGDDTKSSSRRLLASDYANARGAYRSENKTVWRLRSLGMHAKGAAQVNINGLVDCAGLPVGQGSGTDTAIAPVMHIDLSYFHPSIVTNPASQSVKEGSSVTFNVGVGSAASKFTYQWYFAKTESGVGIAISGANSPGYTIPATEVNSNLNGNYYYCEVSNGYSTITSDRAKLTILSYEAPIVSISGNQEVKEGTDVTFSVTAVGGYPTTYIYQWFSAKEEKGVGKPIAGATGASYKIPATEVSIDLNGSYYYCIVSNGKYQVTSNRLKLTVDSDTSLSVSVPLDQSVGIGNSTTFSVVASGGNRLTYSYQWFCSTSGDKEGKPISGATESDYTIDAAAMTFALSGKYYYCVVSDGEHSVTSDSAKLTVLPYKAPTVSAPADQSVEEGKEAIFSVSASGGNPNTYTYQWYFATTENTEGVEISGATSPVYKILSGNVTLDLNGKYYYCVVSNGQYTAISNRAILTVKKKVQPVVLGTTVISSVKLVSANAVTVTWSRVAGATEYNVYRATSANGSYKLIKTLSTLSYTDEKLKKGKTYFYKVKASQGSTFSKDSQVVSKKMKGIPKKPKQKVFKVNHSKGKITFSWKKIKDAKKLEILSAMDGGVYKKWKNVSAKKNKYTSSYKMKKGHKYSFCLRSYYIEDGIKVYSVVSNVFSYFAK